MIHKKTILNLAFFIAIALLFSNCSDSKKQEKEPIKIDKVNVLKTIINVEGMTCEGCESAIQGNLSKLNGVVSVKASHTAKTTVVEYDENQITKKELEKAIVDTGYKIITSDKALKEAPPSSMKCGEGKCGADAKCGNTK